MMISFGFREIKGCPATGGKNGFPKKLNFAGFLTI